MSYRKIFWGVLLVLIGILFILKNTGVLFFSWHTIFHLWPVILILWGISLIPVKDWIKLLISFLTIIIALFAVQRYAPRDYTHWNWEWNDRNDRDNEDEKSITSFNNVMSENFDASTKAGKLVLKIGVGEFTLKDTTDKLVEINHNNDGANYSMTTSTEDSLKIINVSLDKSEFKNGDIKNSVQIKLNPSPVWDLDLNVGAATVDFDLSGFKTRNVNIQGGASEMNIKIGAQLPQTDVKVEAGAASITVRIPQSAGCEIVSNTFLASKDFKGFTKVGSQHYQTPGFEKSTNKIKIDFQAGVASVNVERY